MNGRSFKTPIRDRVVSKNQSQDSAAQLSESSSVKGAKPYKVLHLSTTFNHKAGSTRRTSLSLKTGVDLGHEMVNVFGKSGADYNGAGVRNIQLPVLDKPIHPLNDLKSFWAILKVLRAERPDVLHTHLAKAGLVGRIAGMFMRNTRVIHTVHGPTTAPSMPKAKRVVLNAMERFVRRMTDLYVFVGQELHDKYDRENLGDPAKSVVIFTPKAFERQADFASWKAAKQAYFRTETNTSEASFNMVYVARIVPSKAQIEALHVVNLLKNAGVPVTLSFVGVALHASEMEYYAQLEAFTKENGLCDQVNFLGHRTDAIDLIAGADGFLMTSKYEGLPNVAAEAAYGGTPFFTFDVSGVREVFDGTPFLHLVDQRDASGLADKVKAHIDANVPVQNAQDTHDNITARFAISRFQESKTRLYQAIETGKSCKDIAQTWTNQA